MRSRLIRLVLAAVLVAAAAGAAFVVRDTHQQLDAAAATGRTAEFHVARLELLATELSNAVAAADGAVPSPALLARAGDLMRRFRAEAARLAGLPVPSRPLPSAAVVRDAGAALATALERATTYVDEGADLMAADVLNNDAERGVASLAVAVGRVRMEQAQAIADATAPLVERATMLTAGTAALLALGLILLAATSAKPRGAASPSEPRSGLGLVAPVAAAVPQGAASRDTTDIGRLADLCRDVAAAAAPTELPSLLERTAGLLGAHGVILWAVADGHLVPVAAHGYTAPALRAMGRVPMSDGTPLADACHSFRATAVPAGDGSPAALIVPLGSTGACHGILTAECRHPDGFRGDALAVARIAGGQFAAEFLWADETADSPDQSDPAADLPLDAASA